MISAVGRDYELTAGSALIGVSVGIEIVRASATPSGTILRHTDAALYAAKHAGRGTVGIREVAQINAATV